MDINLQYYEDNAVEYFNNTVNIPVEDKCIKFLKQIPKGGSILDAGCGSGRDSAYFIKNGYTVTAIEWSKKLSELASEYLGQKVENEDFRNINYDNCFDGIWAFASLLHLKRTEFLGVLDKFSIALRQNGILYIALKVGNDNFTYDGGRSSFCYKVDTITKLLEEAHFTIIDTFYSKDNLCRKILWVNLITHKGV